MINTETKRRIDTARDILVGVVPNPTSQIEQITNALIYKFMDDMDQAAIKVGAEPSFFIKDLEQYAWSRLMSDRLGNQERMNMYAEALSKFSAANQLPQLFRDIFRAAFLPYRSPEVLGLFLKEINYFDYNHPEDLGDAYEYLLQVMGSQGDAGQFRTPRYLIDFIVDVVNPTKDDRVLDPACGTAGFLISAYNHILEQHDGKDDPEKKEKPLTPEERKKLFANFEGFDIDPGMVRIAQVNMYLHQFKNPKVGQYDTLSQEERWSDKYDVILANPPFMSPRGGIRPHNKFSIQSTRSEVLFVDYIMNHLRPKGRAGIVVPEGIIFQSGTAYKQLRKALVDDGLYAVVSLPSGVFQPYSGVKTSILFFDNSLSKERPEILFVDVKTVGFSLGASRTPTKENDLATAVSILKQFQKGQKVVDNKLHFVVSKSEIANNNHDLSHAKYRKYESSTEGIRFVPLSEVCRITKGKSSSTKTIEGGYPLILTAETPKTSEDYDFEGEGVCVPLISATGHGKADIKRIHYVNGKFALANLLAFVEPLDSEVINPRYLYWILDSAKEQLASLMKGAANVSMKVSDLESFAIPLPPLGVQQQIVTELDSYKKIIEGAYQIVSNWQPSFTTQPEWPLVTLDEVADVISGQSPAGENYNDEGLGTPFYQGKTEFGEHELGDPKKWTSLVTKLSVRGDILMSVRAPVGPINLNLIGDVCIGRGLAAIRTKNNILMSYLYYALKPVSLTLTGNGGAVFDSINKESIEKIRIPLPSLEVQKQIVDTIDAERIHVESARNLIDLYTRKTASTIAKLWSE